MKALLVTLASSLLTVGASAAVPAKPRLFVLTDIGNEPDDQMSLVRLLLYANDIEIAGIAATTSVWQQTNASPEIAGGVIDGYAAVLPNLRANADGWPDSAELRSKLSTGVARYGLAEINPAHPSPGALALLDAARREDARPLWIAVWGGTATLAEALQIARSHATGRPCRARLAPQGLCHQRSGRCRAMTSPRPSPDGYARSCWSSATASGSGRLCAMSWAGRCWS